MESGLPTVVMNPYEWLPGYGESRVTVRSRGLVSTVEIVYDDIAGSGLRKRDLFFNGVCCCYEASFPGPWMLNFSAKNAATIGSLVEYVESDVARAWRKHFEENRPIKHFAIYFLAENRLLHILAERFELSEPVYVD